MSLPLTLFVHVRKWWKSWRFLELLAFALLVLLFTPLELDHPLIALAMQLVLLNGLLVSLSAAGFAPRMRWAFLATWLVSATLKVTARMTGDDGLAATLDLSSHLVSMLLTTASVIATLRYVLLSRHVTTDTICAAVVAYLFIGLAFASAYYCLYELDSRSFTLPAEMADPTGGALETVMIYFSFVTMATLGYGDIAPRLPLSEMLAVIEAIMGQFYIAVVIAWLVSVYAAGRSQPSRGNDPG